jgi:hypothetical protein
MKASQTFLIYLIGFVMGCISGGISGSLIAQTRIHPGQIDELRGSIPGALYIWSLPTEPTDTVYVDPTTGVKTPADAVLYLDPTASILKIRFFNGAVITVANANQ